MSHTGKSLRKNVGQIFGGVDVNEIEGVGSNKISEEMKSDVDVLGTGVKFRVVCDGNRSLIVKYISDPMRAA